MLGLIPALVFCMHPQTDATVPPVKTPAQSAPLEKKEIKAVIAKMLQKYYVSVTLVGHVRFVQSAEGVSVTIDTDLQYERPSKLYIRQVRTGSSAQQWLVTSDGTTFSYDRPKGVMGRKRFEENIKNTFKDGTEDHFISMIYGASLESLGDRSPFLDVAISSHDRLRGLNATWASFSDKGMKKINGQDVYDFTGDWRPQLDSPSPGKFEMFISKDYDLVRYVVAEKIGLPPEAGGKTIQVTTVWDGDLKVDAPVDSSLFQVAH